MDESMMMSAALQHYRAGRLKEAEEVYRQIAAANPAHAGARDLIGVCCIEANRHEAGLQAIDAAIALDANRADFHTHRALALANLARVDDAIAAAREALRLGPPSPLAWNILGNSLLTRGQTQEAIGCFQSAVALQPADAVGYCNLGNALQQAGRAGDAAIACRKAIALNPNFPEAYNNLGNALRDLHQSDDAMGAYRQALALRADFAQACNNLATCLFDAHRLDEAEAMYRHSLQHQRDNPAAMNNLGNVLHEKYRFDEAVECYRRVLEVAPGYGGALSNMGMALKDLGRIHEAIECYVRLGPADAEADSHRLQMLNYLPEWDGPALLRELRSWGRRQVRAAGELNRNFTNDRSLDRPLRIGYVTADFNDHIAGRNALPLLREHNRDSFQVYCYSNARRRDAFSEKFQSLAHQWRDIVQLDDIQAAQLIRHDEIDVLVDLAVHSTGNRLGIFAHKPAPVQVTFCGYPGGTGLETIDYRLSDVYLDPAENDAVYAERTLRLPNTFWCYDFEAMSLADLPDVTPPPMAHTHAVTFGCLCHHCKINPAVISRWLAVLDAVPGSRMLLLAMPGSQRRWMVEQMRGRADFEEFRPRSQYMALYSRIDIGLDTFPYNGHTTSLDSFWMGVPVVTLMGQTAVSRAGWSQLNNLGLPELAADTDERFVEIAASLARDPDRLGDLRMSMRQRMKSSPLMDARRFARAIEAAYRRIWQEWAKR